MRLAVIGNSHIAALKAGWTGMAADHPDRQLVFFGARGDSLDALVAQDGRLVPANAELARSIAVTSGGLRCIDPGEFDAFLLHGMNAQPNFRREGFYSQAVMDQAVQDLCEQTLSHRTLDKICRLTDRPIYVGHNPLIAAERTDEDQDLAPYHSGVDDLNAAFYRRFSARLVPQPEITIANGRNTAMAFSTGSRALSVGGEMDDIEHPATELSHMNATFGAVWMACFLNICG